MTETPKIIVALPSGYASVNLPANIDAAHMTYCIGRGFRLYKARERFSRSGGFMVLEISRFQGGGPIAAITENVISECIKRHFKGVVLDSCGLRETPATLALVQSLSLALQKKGLLLFVPEVFGDTGRNAIVRVTTALSGGTLTRHLQDCTKKYGIKNLAVEIERVRMDFSLPSHSGTGHELSVAGLDTLMSKRDGKTFYSPELAANYFIHHENSQPKFVLFDDADSIKKKLSLVRDTGIPFAFLFYPQVSDILDDVL